MEEERSGRREAESRLRAAADSLTQRLDDHQRRQTDERDAAAKNLLATARNAEAAALAARQEAARRADDHDTRYISQPPQYTGCC